MSSFSLHIATDNAAFRPDNDTEPDGLALETSDELARILRAVADKIDRDGITSDDPGAVVDANGNRCGRYYWTGRTARLDDGAALDRIAHQLTGREWDAGDIEGAALAVTDTGRTIDPPRGDE